MYCKLHVPLATGERLLSFASIAANTADDLVVAPVIATTDIKQNKNGLYKYSYTLMKITLI